MLQSSTNDNAFLFLNNKYYSNLFYEFIIYAVLIHSITKGLPYDIEISVTILKDLKCNEINLMFIGGGGTNFLNI